MEYRRENSKTPKQATSRLINEKSDNRISYHTYKQSQKTNLIISQTTFGYNIQRWNLKGGSLF